MRNGDDVIGTFNTHDIVLIFLMPSFNVHSYRIGVIEMHTKCVLKRPILVR